MTQNTLNAHLLIHFGEKKHLCNFCGNSFLSRGQLKIHERLHTKEKPYKCMVSLNFFTIRKQTKIDCFSIVFALQCGKHILLEMRDSDSTRKYGVNKLTSNQFRKNQRPIWCSTACHLTVSSQILAIF